MALLSSFSNVSAQSTVSPYPWSILDFCRDLSTTSCRRQSLLFGYSSLAEFDYSKVLLRTFIHCSAQRIDYKLGATVTGLIRSSAKSSSPSRLVAAASDIGAERIGSTSWISGKRTTTSMHLFCRPGGCCLRRLGRCSYDHLGFKHNAFNRHSFGDYASLDLCSYQHKTCGISTRGL
jgi:hypothetical protein